MSANVQELRNVRAGGSRGHTARAGSGATNPLLAVLVHLRRRFVQARQRRQAIEELSRLDDRQLQDIGLRRDQIREVIDATMQWHASADR